MKKENQQHCFLPLHIIVLAVALTRKNTVVRLMTWQLIFYKVRPYLQSQYHPTHVIYAHTTASLQHN